MERAAVPTDSKTQFDTTSNAENIAAIEVDGTYVAHNHHPLPVGVAE